MSNKNLIRQEIVLKDGSKKAVFHQKKTNGPRFANLKEIWDWSNKQPKPNSKRQKQLLAAKKEEELSQAA